MRLTFFGGLAVGGSDGGRSSVRGRGQEALLLRLAIDAGTTVTYRALADDVWPDDPPEDPRASLQSLASRLRRALPPGTLEADHGGYRLALDRGDVDLTRFQDLVAQARRADDPARAAALAREALDLWIGDPWTPGDGFDWLVRDLLEDRAHAERLMRAESPAHAAVPAGAEAAASLTAATSAAPAVPAALTTLVGRSPELDLIAAQLASERLVTLIGPGGAGKTTLALETARRRQGPVVVELAPAASGEVWSAVAGAVGRSVRLLEPVATVDDRERALDALAGRTALIVLDNCEHVSAEAAGVASELLRAVPGVRILATSREPLGVPGEAFVDLGPLSDADGFELFAQRVRAARGSRPGADETETATRIVRRLDGLPLALELAAAKSRTLTLPEIDAGLDDRFALLASGPRAADPRHRTLRALIDWSWETLSDAEREALLAAAVFPDGIGAADTAVVAAQFGTDAAAFDRLVDRSLLHRTDGRFRMLETVREYGIDRLRADGGETRARAHAATALTTLAETRDPLLRGPRVREALAWFDANDESLLAAARLTRDDPALRETGARLLRACLWAWMMRERFAEIQAGVTRFAHRADHPAAEPAAGAPADPASEPQVVIDGLALLVHGFALNEKPDAPTVDEITAFGRRAEAIAQAATRHPSELALALPPLLRAAATALADPATRYARTWGFDVTEVDDRDAPPWTRALLAVLRTAFAQNSGRVDVLGRESERALAMFRELGDAWGIALASQLRSEWLLLEGRLEEALEVADASTIGLEGLTSLWDLIQQRALAIRVLVRLGRVGEARRRLDEIRLAVEQEGSDRSLVQYLFTAAGLELMLGDGEAALRELDAIPGGEPTGPEAQLRAWESATRAQALVLCGRPDDAREALRAAFVPAVRSGDQPIIAEVVMGLAAWLADIGRDDDARRALAASAHLRGRADETDPVYLRLRDRLGPLDPSLDATVEELEEMLK